MERRSSRAASVRTRCFATNEIHEVLLGLDLDGLARFKLGEADGGLAGLRGRSN